MGVLNKMLKLTENMFFGKNSASLRQKPFQSGITVSIKSTLDLYSELKNEGISYLLTARLNQDALENVFSQIRALGGNRSHPTSVDTINRIRTICLSKNAHTIVSNSCPVESHCDGNTAFISADLLNDLSEQDNEDDESIFDDEIMCSDIEGTECFQQYPL